MKLEPKHFFMLAAAGVLWWALRPGQVDWYRMNHLGE